MNIDMVSVFVLTVFLGFLRVGSVAAGDMSEDRIDLAGKWSFRLDPKNIGKKEAWFGRAFDQSIVLPGTLAQNGYGELPRKYTALDGPIQKVFVGSAWYQRQITLPESWRGKHITLFFERARWKTTVWINGISAGSQNSLGTPHEYDVSGLLKPGSNTITVCVDNRQPFTLGSISSTMVTQGNWNGIIGRIELIRSDKVWLKSIRSFPDIKSGTVRFAIRIGNICGTPVSGSVEIRVVGPDGSRAGSATAEFEGKGSGSMLSVTVKLKRPLQLWSEFTPNLYQCNSSLTADAYTDRHSVEFGMREVANSKKHILINGKPVYIRGTLECANFPLTGYPAMDLPSWLKIMKIIKSNGLNEIRFHSWTPPEAAFRAADLTGLYLLPEGPRANVGNDPARDVFVRREMLRINLVYGNHPSFVLFSSGNELMGFRDAKGLLSALHADDPRHLYCFSSGGRGMEMKTTDNIVLQNFEIGGSRGFPFIRGRMGHGNAKTYYDHHKTPRNDHDLGNCGNRGIPILAHELGQWGVYPSMKEIAKYSGVMVPVNLLHIRDDLKKKGMLAQADDFTRVTASHAAVLYREEIETMMRSPGSGGFALLQLNDYPCQGTAHVGLYNAFWDNKGGITPGKFSRFCRATVPLLRTAKYVYSNDESFEAAAELFHYGDSTLKNVQPYWRISNRSGMTVAEGNWAGVDIVPGTNTPLGSLKFDLSTVVTAQKLVVEAGLRGTGIVNDWDIWVYPANNDIDVPGDIAVSRQFDATVKSALHDGKKVLLLPRYKDLKKALRGRFVPPFWSPAWWWTRNYRGNVSMSILCDPAHPALRHFPTEEYSNWQWANLLDSSASFILDDMPPSLKPIVQVVDNFSRNHKLANIFEAKVGNGRILVCGLDLVTDLEHRPVARQMRRSLLEYIESEDFNPGQTLLPEDIKGLYKTN